MIKMAKDNTGERIVKMETKIDNIETTQKEHTLKLDKMEEKLDKAIVCKVDRSEYHTFRRQINAFVIALVLMLLGLIGYLIDKLYITK